MNKPRKYCGKKLLDRTKILSTRCFESAVDDVLVKMSIDTEKHPKYHIIRDMRLANSIFRNLVAEFEIHPQIDLIKEEVDALYLEKLCELSTKDIEDIIWADDQKKFRRAPRTIEALTSELTRRVLIDDSSQSESIPTDTGGARNVKLSKKPRRSSGRKKRKGLKSRRRN